MDRVQQAMTATHKGILAVSPGLALLKRATTLCGSRILDLAAGFRSVGASLERMRCTGLLPYILAGGVRCAGVFPAGGAT